MRSPVACNDAGLLEDEPFRTSFFVCGAANSSRTAGEQSRQRLQTIATQELIREPGGMAAASTWIKMAFARRTDRDPNHEIVLNDELLQIFVAFYWKLYQNDSQGADIFLQHERKKRGYGSFAYTVPSSTKSIDSPAFCSARPLARKKSISSQRASIGAKRRLLQTHSQGGPRNRLSPTSIADGLVASGLPNLERAFDRGPKISRRSRRGRAADTRTTPFPDQLHGRPVVPTGTGAAFETTHRVLSKTFETLESLGVCGQDACHPSQSRSHSLPLKASRSQSCKTVYPGLKETLSKPNPSVANGQHPSSAHLSCQDVIGSDEVLMSSCPESFHMQDDTKLIIEEPTTDVYRCRPPLDRFPPIWAQSRQEVCESFEWFRSYQGGVYFIHNVVKGYLLSAFSSCRDLFEHDGRLIISHGGGKAESIHSRQGQTLLQVADDQLAQDKSVRALLTTYKLQRPLVLLIDDKYTLFPFDLSTKDVTYAVLGLYTIAHVWAECQPAHNERGHVVRYKFAFQWCEGQGEPWWIPKKEENMDFVYSQMHVHSGLSAPTSLPGGHYPVSKLEDSQLANVGPLRPEDIYFACTYCLERTPQVYQQGWACLNPSCCRFWISVDGSRLPFRLQYNLQFLRLLPSYVLPCEIRDIRPPLPVCSAPDGITTTHSFTRGWHCRGCGRLSCRFKWQHWECMWCKATFDIPGKIRIPKEFWTQKTPESFQDHSVAKLSGIIQQPARQFFHGRGRGQTQTFILPYGRGRIHHIQPGPPSGNSDADLIFAAYQEQASDGQLAFQRWPLRSHKCRGPLLTNYFSQNSGEPYQYVGGTANTVPFSRAPSAVIKARDLIQTRVSQALAISPSFNEVLSCAYMERQKMAFHSDSEVGLGPFVAGLSLGSPALMHFRLRAKYDRDKKLKSIAITFVLRHGDILVMDGAGVQEYYEHTVVPTNFRIAATARWIGSVHSRLNENNQH